MSLVYAGICCHAPGITSRPEAVAPELLARLHGAFDRQRRALVAAKVEAIVVVSAEHFANFFLDKMPAFAVGMADWYEGPIENPAWLRIARTRVPGNAELSRRIVSSLLHEVDVAYTEEYRFDHGMSVPLHFLTPEYRTPVIPVNINCQSPPLPPLHRVWQLGRALRRAIDQEPARMALIGTGGTSHWPCTPDSGHINADWDRVFLDHVLRRRDAELLAYSDDDVLREAGHGGFEIRTSTCVAAATLDGGGELHFCEPVPAFATSCVVATLYGNA